ncbi:hypothetical protein [Granulicella aggregans]|jgi:hypothetical protein|uniref:hypothetical protein n=1 Tax=Granulicella aggregans TaxID=474949 RepID=UPI0021E02698|nr:hypothetical protein [Granulicella aggregans]
MPQKCVYQQEEGCAKAGIDCNCYARSHSFLKVGSTVASGDEQVTDQSGKGNHHCHCLIGFLCDYGDQCHQQSAYRGEAEHY